MNTFPFITFLFYIFQAQPSLSDNNRQVKLFLQEMNTLWANSANKYFLAEWNYNTNMTNETLNDFVSISQDVTKQQKMLWTTITKFPWQNITDPYIRRQFELFSTNLEFQVLPEELYLEFERLRNVMISIPSTVKISRRPNEPATLSQSDVQYVLTISKDAEERSYLLSEWTKCVGREAKKIYPRYVELMNEAAKLQNLPNAEYMWLRCYSEFVNIKTLAQNWWKQLEPLYKEVHAYVRYKLRLKYGDIVPADGAIPAYLLVNLLGIRWEDIHDIILPYPNPKELKIEEALRKQHYTPLSIMKNGNEFLQSLHLPNFPNIFWSKSIFETPSDGRKMIAAILAYKLYQSNDAFTLAHLSVSASSYFLSHWLAAVCRFKRTAFQPYIFEDMPKGVYNGIAGAIMLSATSNTHLRKCSLMPHKPDSFEEQINNLLCSALHNVAFIPQAYIVDLWRWNVFSGKITPENYNTAWWSLRLLYEGVDSDESVNGNEFDLATTIPVLYGNQYFPCYISTILSFQIHKALCTEAGLYLGRNSGKPLHKCDIYGSVEAGNLLKAVLKLGRSKPFPDLLETLTGERNLNTSVLLEFYEPLMTWLKEENRKNGVIPGWSNHKFKPKNFWFE